MVKAFIAGAIRESAAGSAAASRIGSTKRFMGPHIHNVAIVAILSRTRYHRVLNRFGGITNGQHIPGANPGTDSQFPACQSRVCGAFRRTSPKTVRHPLPPEVELPEAFPAVIPPLYGTRDGSVEYSAI